MATHYRKPRKINFISLLLLLIALAGAYVGIQFGPPYWRKWKVKGVLDEVANEALRFRQRAAAHRERLQVKALKRLKDLGIEDAGVQVHVTVRERECTVAAEYKEVIRHWFVNKVTTLNFRPVVHRTLQQL